MDETAYLTMEPEPRQTWMVARPGHTDVHNFLGTGEGADSLHPREQDGAAPTRRFLPHWPDAGRDMSRPGPLPDTATWASPRAEDASDGRDSVSDHGAGAPADTLARTTLAEMLSLIHI